MAIDPTTQANLDKIGTWDGVTSQSALQGPYTDIGEQYIPWGGVSYFGSPWRSYVDVWDKTKLFQGMGVNFNVSRDEADAVAAVLSEAGVTNARIEVGWNALSYDDDTKLKDSDRQQLQGLLTALKKYGIRPIVLLNTNSGMPAPNAQVRINVTKAASAGDRVVYFTVTSGTLTPNYTGFSGMAYRTMYPVITEYDAAAGKATLSAPLPQALTTGSKNLVKLKYQPFSPPVFAGGKANPASQETLDGWMTYVKTVSDNVTALLGTTAAADRGFDIEVYNELSFGWEFLDINQYYNPTLSFTSQPVSFTKDGKTKTGVEILLPMTADYARQNLPGVSVISGFANQRPWDSGTTLWLEQGFSRHYYTEYATPKSNIYTNSGSDMTTYKKSYYHALHSREANPDGSLGYNGNYDWTAPGTYYIPPHIKALPEEWFYPYQTEMIVRDLLPFPGAGTLGDSADANHRFRFASPGKGIVPQIWETETNFIREQIASDVAAQAGVSADNQKVIDLMHQIGAKATLRQYVFLPHKGLTTINLYAVKSDIGFNMLPDAFFSQLAKDKYVLTAAGRALIGPQLTAVKNMANLMKQGTTIASPRPLVVANIVEYKPRLVFGGDGTAKHPSRYHRDDLAILPYQLDENKFAIAYYVVTRNMAHVWDSSKDPLDPVRYDMPPQDFDITLKNIYGTGVTVSAYDPKTNTSVPAQIVSAGPSTLTVRIQSVEYPRMLLITEAKASPVISAPELTKTAGGAQVSFTPNVDCVATFTYGDYPVRSGGTFLKENFSADGKTKLGEEQVNCVNADLKTGNWKWSGTIIPLFSETYTFTIQVDNWFAPNLKINGQAVTVNRGVPGNAFAEVPLTAGLIYTFELTYSNNDPNNAEQYVRFFWSSASQPNTLVSPANTANANKITLTVFKNQKTTVPLSGLKTGQGARITLTSSDGISTRYPLWDYDPKLVLYDNTPPAPVNSTISPTSATFDKSSVAQMDLLVTMTLNGNTLVSIVNGAAPLVLNTDYTVAGSIVMIKKSYLAARPVGATSLTFNFSAGAAQSLVVTVKDSTPVNSSISPTSATFDKSSVAQMDLLVTMTLNGNTLVSIVNGAAPLVLNTDYTVAGSIVTIKKSYLASRPVGTTTLTFNFSAGAAQSLVVTVKDSTPVNSSISPTSATFDKSSVAQMDILVTMTLNGNTLVSIVNGAAPLVLNTDYTVAGSIVTIKKSYLAARPVGATSLTFNFSAGAAQSLVVTVKDSTPVNSSISPTSATFDKSSVAQMDILVTMTLNGNTLVSIVNGATPLVLNTDYTVAGSIVTIKKSYLATRPVGTTSLAFNFSAGAAQSLVVTVKDTTPINSSISPTSATFDKSSVAQMDILVTMTLNGNTLVSIVNGAAPLVLNTDYTVAGSIVTIKKSYLAARPVGATSLTFNFSVGAAQSLVVTVKDSTPVNSSISPTSAIFDKNAAAQTDIVTTMTLNGNTLVSIANGAVPLVLNTDYTVAGSIVTIKKSYLAARPVGTTTLTFNFSAGAAQSLVVTVKDTTPPRKHHGHSKFNRRFKPK